MSLCNFHFMELEGFWWSNKLYNHKHVFLFLEAIKPSTVHVLMRILGLTLLKSSILASLGTSLEGVLVLQSPTMAWFRWMQPSSKEVHQSIPSLWKVLNLGCLQVSISGPTCSEHIVRT